MEPTTGIEPVTPSLPRKCSTTEPRGPVITARIFRFWKFWKFFKLWKLWNRSVLKLERETGLGPATLSLEG